MEKLTFKEAVRSFRDGLHQNNLALRAERARSLPSCVRHFLSTHDQAEVFASFVPLIHHALGDSDDDVRTKGLEALSHIAGEAGLNHQTLLQESVTTLIEHKVDLRANLIRQFLLHLADNHRPAAEQVWQRAQSLPASPLPNPRNIYEKPDFSDWRAIMMTTAGMHHLASDCDEGLQVGKALLTEALTELEPRLQVDLADASKIDKRGFVWKTLYGNGLVVEATGDRRAAHEFYRRAQYVFEHLVTAVGSLPSDLDIALGRTCEKLSSNESPGRIFVDLLVRAEFISIENIEPTARLLEDLERILSDKSLTSARLGDFLLEHGDVEELYASNADLRTLLEAFG